MVISFDNPQLEVNKVPGDGPPLMIFKFTETETDNQFVVLMPQDLATSIARGIIKEASGLVVTGDMPDGSTNHEAARRPPQA